MSEIKYTVATARRTVDVRSGYHELITPTIAVGPGKDQRIGWKVKYKYLQFRAEVRLNVSAVPSALYPDAVIRVILWQSRLQFIPPVWDPSANGGFGGYNPAVGTLNLWNSNTVPWLSSLNNNFARVIMDRTYKLQNGSVTGSQTNLINSFTIKKKVRVNNNVNFAGPTTSVPDDPKDNYYLTIVSGTISQSAAPAYGTNRIDIEWQDRLSYIDL